MSDRPTNCMSRAVFIGCLFLSWVSIPAHPCDMSSSICVPATSGFPPASFAPPGDTGELDGFDIKLAKTMPSVVRQANCFL